MLILKYETTEKQQILSLRKFILEYLLELEFLPEPEFLLKTKNN